ncbi:unnamed protein product [Ascophyllum nodosum]
MPAKKERRMPTGGAVERPAKELKKAKTASARTPKNIARQQQQLEAQKSQLALREAAVEAREKAVQAAEVAIATREAADKRAAGKRQENEQQQQQQQQQRDKTQKEAQDTQQTETLKVKTDFIKESVEKLKPKSGEILTQAQSRIILVMLFDLQGKGISQNQAIIQVADTLKVGRRKLFRVYNHWWHEGKLLETTGTGRGKAISDSDGRRKS